MTRILRIPMVPILFTLCLAMTSYLFIVQGVYLIAGGILKNGALLDLSGMPVGHDFLVFWAAGKLARGGEAAAVYSFAALHAVMKETIGAEIPRWAWNYPPTYLLFMAPLSLLPFPAALLLWSLGGLAGFLWLMRRIAPHRLAPWLFLSLPPAVYNLFAGQNGFLSVLFQGGGLLLLERHPWAAGFCLGLSTFKPHLAVIAPVALLAGRYWKALGGYALGAAGLALVSLAATGTEVWIAFGEHIRFAGEHWQSDHFWSRMPTVYASARLSGGAVSAASLLQGAVSLAALGGVVWVWSRRPSLAYRGSALVLGTLLASPYLFSYDLALLGLPLAWLGWEAHEKREGGGKALLMFWWIGLYFTCFILPGKNLQLTAFLLAAIFVFTLFRFSRTA